MINELASKKLTPENVKDAVDWINTGTDAVSMTNVLLNGKPEESKNQVDALLFINSVFETAKWVDYDKLIDQPMFKQMANVKGATTPGDWFTQAKLIGEVYSDAIVQYYSWKNIDRLTEDSGIMSQKVNLLINKQEQTIKQIDCLEKCIEGNDGKCMNSCTGKSRFHTPPPMLE